MIQQIGSTSTVHDHSSAVADEQGFVDQTRDLSVTCCLAPATVAVSGTVLSVAGNGSSICCTGGGLTIALEVPDMITAAAVTPNGQGIVFTEWDDQTQQSSWCYCRMPRTIHDFAPEDAKTRIVLSLTDCIYSHCCDSKIVTINFSTCGSDMLIGSASGDVLAFSQLHTQLTEAAEEASWRGLNPILRPGWVHRSNRTSEGAHRIVRCGFSFDKSTVWWVSGNEQQHLSIGCRQGVTRLPSGSRSMSNSKYRKLDRDHANRETATADSYDKLAVEHASRMAVRPNGCDVL